MIDPNIAPAHAPFALDKTSLRQQLLAQRKAMPAEVRARAQDALGAHLIPWLEHLRGVKGESLSTCVGVYWPIAGEPDLTPAWAVLSTRGFDLALPVATARGHVLEYRAWNGSALAQRDASGVPAPLDAPACVVDVVLIPCVGVQAGGWRLGYGGGYFDRTLAAWAERKDAPAIATMGVAFERQRCDFEPDAHDRRLDALLTENGVQHWRRNAGS